MLGEVTAERIQDLAQELAAGKVSLVSVGQADEAALSRILSEG
jgi:hypothetical protein